MLRRPPVFQLRSKICLKHGVKLRVFAVKHPTVGRVELNIPQPPRPFVRAVKIFFLGPYLAQAGVFVPSGDPSLTDGLSVAYETVFVSLPHDDGGMVLPPVGGV